MATIDYNKPKTMVPQQTRTLNINGSGDGGYTLAEQKQHSQNIMNNTPMQQGGYAGRGQYDPTKSEAYKRNPLLRSVVDASQGVMQRTVRPKGEHNDFIRNFNALSQDNHRQGTMNNMMQRLAENARQFNSSQQMQAQQFDRTHDLNMQNSMMDRAYKQQLQYQNQNKPLDAVNRGKAFDATWMNNYNGDTLDYLKKNEDKRDLVKAHYAQTGQYPQVDYKKNGWFSADDFSITSPQQEQFQQQQQMQNPNEVGQREVQSRAQQEADEFQRWLTLQQHNDIMNRDERY